MRIRVLFAKTDSMRYTGHLDLFRALERTIRRAKLPLAYTQGFKPHPRINLASALPLGFTSEAEIADIWLQRNLPVDEIYLALQTNAPPGIMIRDVSLAPEDSKSLQSELFACDYLITLLEPIPDLEQRIQRLLDAETLPRERNNKPYDLRPLIEQLSMLPDSKEGWAQMQVRLAAREGATGRPEEVIAELGGDPLAVRYHRLRLVFGSSVISA